jgi:hypothetical protein
VTPAELCHAFAELDLMRSRRELMFWTITMTLAVIVLVAMTVAFVVSLIQGSSLDPAHMAVGTGITGTCAGVRIFGLMRRPTQSMIPVHLTVAPGRAYHDGDPLS